MADVPMRHVRMWVIVSLIPPRYEEPDNLRSIGNLLGGYLDYDRTECIVYNMITHAREKCDGTHTILGTSRSINFGAQPKPGYAFSAKPITNVAINPMLVVSLSPVVKRKHVVASDLETSPIVVEADVGKDVILSTTPSKKRGRNEGCSPSPKKIKTVLGGKLLKQQTESLSLVDIRGDDEPLVTLKKKLGRRLSSRNKVPRSTKKTKALLRIAYPIAAKEGDKASPSAKGKGKT
ncbi:hypothetical protein ACLB2K_048309 [Fragaria x ananassa]